MDFYANSKKGGGDDEGIIPATLVTHSYNVDAYIRLTDYAVLKIKERMARRLFPQGFMEEWRKKILGGGTIMSNYLTPLSKN